MLLLPTAYFTERKIDLLNLVAHLFFLFEQQRQLMSSNKCLRINSQGPTALGRRARYQEAEIWHQSTWGAER